MVGAAGKVSRFVEARSKKDRLRKRNGGYA